MQTIRGSSSAVGVAEVWHHQSVAGWLALALAGLLCLMAGSALAKNSLGATVGTSPSQQAAVEDLPVCYARGTDTLGRAVNAVPPTAPDDLENPIHMNSGDAEFNAALALYRACFSANFSFTLEFDGFPLLTVPAPGSGATDPALQWANFVNNAFRGPGFKNTQHHMGSISSEINGNTAHVVSYLIATHAYADPALGVRVVGGTYTDQVVREGGRWVILQRTLNITSNVEVPGGLTPPAP